MIKEFKKFISRGNVVDLAVGVVIGGAFSKIVTSLVDNIIMPIVGIIIGGIDFTNLNLKVWGVKIEFGIFIQNVVDFLIVALCIFIFVRIFNNITHKNTKKEYPNPIKSDEVVLLEEIRDLLKEKNKK